MKPTYTPRKYGEGPEQQWRDHPFNKTLTKLTIDDQTWEWSQGEYWDYLYFVKALENNRIKVGMSARPNRRIDELCAHGPSPLEVLLVVAISWHHSRAIEKAIHHKFEHLNHHGEWFDIESDLLEFIELLKKEEEME